MPLILGTNSIKDTGYDVANSLRFNPGSTDTLTRTFGTPTNNKKFTISFWIKKCENGREQHIFGAGSSSQFYFNSSDQLYFYDQTSGNTIYKSTQLFRDPSAWHHIVVAEDTTVATAGNRLRIYLNGSEVTNFATETHPTQDNASAYNTASAHTIGTYPVSPSGYYLSAYLAEFVFIDGQQLDPTSFGEFDEDSPTIWKPKDVSGLTFGNNGFHLDFENASSLGADVSGNGNNFTVNNLTSVDQTTDTCTNNFATLNPLDNYYANSAFSEGNCSITTTTSNYAINTSTFGVSSGKWYWEAKVGSVSGSNDNFGITDVVQSSTSQALATTAGAYSRIPFQGRLYEGTSYTASWGSTYTTGDIMSVALDLENNRLYFAKNGTFENSGDPTSSTGAISITPASNTTNGVYFAGFGDFGSNTQWLVNFGNPTFSISSGNSDANGFGNFEYAVPSGYFSLCTKNLAEFG